ncbi:MAG TPA: hypothetical protein VLK29_11055 [Luteimonas sp.]|nr:hypothetical protein [Luteimonas sp.]
MSAASLTTCVSCLLVALVVASPAHADGRNDRGRGERDRDARDRDVRDERPPRSGDALADSVRRIERNKRGQVLSAERVPYDGRDINRIKVVDDRGRVRVYMDDPARGQPVRTRDDDD